MSGGHTHADPGRIRAGDFTFADAVRFRGEMSPGVFTGGQVEKQAVEVLAGVSAAR